MIKDTFRVARTGLPIISNREIDKIAEHIVADYDPELLAVPQPVPIEMIIESYFGLLIDYQYLSHDGHIWGAMIFRNGTIQIIYNPETRQAEDIVENRGTVLIDTRLLSDECRDRMRTTMAHECGHWLFHREYFRRSIGEGIAAARAVDGKGVIQGDGGHYLVTDHDWMEHHANYFSGAILMPESSFRKAAESPEVEKAVWLVYRRSCAEARDALAARCLASIFHVSTQATRLRMQQLGITMGEGMSIEEFKAASEEALARREKKRPRGRRARV